MNSNDIEKMIVPRFHALGPYVPVEPPDVISRKLGVAEDSIIKLDGNENPYGCSPSVQEALSYFRQYHRYPDPEQRRLRMALEEHTGISRDMILAGAGSDELIELILKLFLEPGDKTISCTPTFGMYRFCTEVCGGSIVEVPRCDDFSLDIPSIRKAIDQTTKVLFITSPNNPSGNIANNDEIEQLLECPVIVVVDEAYHEFSRRTCAALMKKHHNLIVLRTFSKWAGLAGLRIGYGFFPENIIPYLMKIKQPYNINVAAQIAAIESIRDSAYLQTTVDAIIAERERLFDKLSRLDWLTAYPSHSNYILCKVLRGDAKQIHKALQHAGIFIRYYDMPLLQNFLRFSVGKPEHTDRILKALEMLQP